METTTESIIEIIKPYQVLHQANNYIQYIDQNGVFKQAQKCYKSKRWYNFRESGKSLCPVETFENWIN